jgi:endogenous inhibitor of DNA gyrase (YacG/DUF329 family)
MREYQIDPKIREMWKVYPVRIEGRSTSWCHREPTLLVQSMEGGFVTRNCPTCGKFETLPEAVFLKELNLWVACPNCKRRMKPGVVFKNYAFVCETCDIFVKLAELLPRWSDL